MNQDVHILGNLLPIFECLKRKDRGKNAKKNSNGMQRKVEWCSPASSSFFGIALAWLPTFSSAFSMSIADLLRDSSFCFFKLKRTIFFDSKNKRKRKRRAPDLFLGAREGSRAGGGDDGGEGAKIHIQAINGHLQTESGNEGKTRGQRRKKVKREQTWKKREPCGYRHTTRAVSLVCLLVICDETRSSTIPLFLAVLSPVPFLTQIHFHSFRCSFPPSTSQSIFHVGETVLDFVKERGNLLQRLLRLMANPSWPRRSPEQHRERHRTCTDRPREMRKVQGISK